MHAELTAMWAQADKKIEGREARPAHDHVFTWPDGTRFKADWVTHEFDVW